VSAEDGPRATGEIVPAAEPKRSYTAHQGYVLIERGHAWTDPDPTFLDSDEVYPCRYGPDCPVKTINSHPIHHVQRTATYSVWTRPQAQEGPP